MRVVMRDDAGDSKADGGMTGAKELLPSQYSPELLSREGRCRLVARLMTPSKTEAAAAASNAAWPVLRIDSRFLAQPRM
jgi:hypothetical protein